MLLLKYKAIFTIKYYRQIKTRKSYLISSFLNLIFFNIIYFVQTLKTIRHYWGPVSFQILSICIYLYIIPTKHIFITYIVAHIRTQQEEKILNKCKLRDATACHCALSKIFLSPALLSLKVT